MPGTSIGTPSMGGHARHGVRPTGAANSSTFGRSTDALATGAGFGAAGDLPRDADAAARGASTVGGWTAARWTTFGDSWTGGASKASGDSMATGGSNTAGDSAASNSIDSKMVGGSNTTGSASMNGSSNTIGPSSRIGSSTSIGDSAADCAIGLSKTVGAWTGNEASSDAPASARTSSNGGSVYVPNGSPPCMLWSVAGGASAPNSLDRSSAADAVSTFVSCSWLASVASYVAVSYVSAPA